MPTLHGLKGRYHTFPTIGRGAAHPRVALEARWGWEAYAKGHTRTGTASSEQRAARSAINAVRELNG